MANKHTPMQVHERDKTVILLARNAGGFCIRGTPDAEQLAADLVRSYNAHDELVAALREARSNLRHAEHCNSNRPMVPPRGFNRYACDCGCDHARNVATDALSKVP